jgi:DNA-binding CsgD family transcriptional regulator
MDDAAFRMIGFDLSATAMLRLDAELRVLAANGAATDLLQRQAAIAVTAGVLRPRRVAERAALQLASQRLCEGMTEGKKAVLLRSRQGMPLIMIVLRASPGGMVLASLTELEGAAPPEPAALSELFGLTGSEARVLALVAVGVAPTEVAKRLSLQPETVRGHLKAGMRKLGLSSQAQVAACVLRAVEAWRS